jgi:DNA-binding beta-propeller fold protein YncE
MVADTDSNLVQAWDPAASPPRLLWSTTVNNDGTLADPYGVACDPATGQVYVGNSNAKDIVVFDNSGNQLGTIGAGTIAGFSRGIWVDGDGSVWLDVGTSGQVYHFAAWNNGGGYLGSFPVIAHSDPYGIAGDANYLYISLSTPNEVGQYTRDGTLVGTFGGYGLPVGKMQTPQGLTFGPDGKLYVVEEGNNRIAQWSVP